MMITLSKIITIAEGIFYILPLRLRLCGELRSCSCSCPQKGYFSLVRLSGPIDWNLRSRPIDCPDFLEPPLMGVPSAI